MKKGATARRTQQAGARFEGVFGLAACYTSLPMATIGHTLVGLSFAGMSRAKARDNAMKYVWPGLMILMGHLVDVLEWFTVVLFPSWKDGHYLTHSFWATFCFLLVIFGCMRWFSKLRRPWPYALVAFAVLSHLLLDALWGRSMLANAYHVLPEEGEGREGYPLWPMVVAEVWLYGLMLLAVLLWRGASMKAAPRRGRQAAVALGVVAVLAAATRITVVWAPVYVVGYLHALLMLRRDWTLKLAWGIVPLVPLGMCLVGEIYASNLVRSAWNLLLAKDYPAAIAAYERSLRFPARASRVMTYVHIGQCYDYMGQLPEAEASFMKAIDADEKPNAGQYWLAWFHANRNWQNTSYYRPAESMQMLRELLKSDARQKVKESAARLLADLETRPGIPHAGS